DLGQHALREIDSLLQRESGHRMAPYGEMTWPVAVPSTLPTYACATVAAGKPSWSGMPSACRVSVTQGGLTTLIRIPRGASSAAARVKPSRPAFTRLTAPLPRDGCWARMPLVMVIEPVSTTAPSPYLTRLTWPMSLLSRLKRKSVSESSSRDLKQA